MSRLRILTLSLFGDGVRVHHGVEILRNHHHDAYHFLYPRSEPSLSSVNVRIRVMKSDFRVLSELDI